MEEMKIYQDLVEYIRENYEDANNSLIVLDEYGEDYIPSYFNSMREAVLNSQNTIELDTKLDMMLTNNIRPIHDFPLWDSDSEAKGYRGIALRVLEDG